MSTLLVTCVDARIHDHLHGLEDLLDARGSDRLQVPGGPLALVTAGVQQDAMLAWIDLLARLKGVDTVCLVSHQRCLAYQHKLGGFFHDEREVLERDLQWAKRVVEDRVFRVRARCYLVPWDDEIPGGGYLDPVPIE